MTYPGYVSRDDGYVICWTGFTVQFFNSDLLSFIQNFYICYILTTQPQIYRPLVWPIIMMDLVHNSGVNLYLHLYRS